MDKDYQALCQDAVISISRNNDKFVMPHLTFVASQGLAAIVARQSNSEEIRNSWTELGIPCEVLVPHMGWRKGKIRLCFEFCPEEIEATLSPKENQLVEGQNIDALDELRLSIAEESSNG